MGYKTFCDRCGAEGPFDVAAIRVLVGLQTLDLCAPCTREMILTLEHFLGFNLSAARDQNR